MKILVLFIFSGFLFSADLAIRDLNLSVCLSPAAFDGKLSKETGDLSFSDSFSSSIEYRLGGAYSISPVGSSYGLVLGLDLVVNDYGYDSSDSLTGYVGQLSLGCAKAWNWKFVSQLDAFYGMGQAEMSLSSSDTFSAQVYDGDSTVLGVRLQNSYLINRSTRAFLDVGFVQKEWSLSNGNDSLDIDASGLQIGLGFSWRISDTSRRLD